MHVRAGTESDWSTVAEIQATSFEAAQWDVSGYPLLIAVDEDRSVGFLAWLETAPDEAEILNLAVDPAFRRRGAATALVAAVPRSMIFLEVRESNHAALSFYRKAGFTTAGVRFGYYHSPPESAIVMRLKK
ncbi:MAG: rimI [Bryobacterales bacterium]|nr:rimI [Bryobacterales bacterium]